MTKPICGVCGEKCSMNRFKIKKSDAWICSSCFKKGGGISMNIRNITIEELRELIAGKEEIYREKQEANAIGLRSAEAMYKYTKSHGFGAGFDEEWALKHFKVLEDHLLLDEEVLMTFIGLHNMNGTKSDWNYAYAITNKRIIMGHKDLIVGEKFHTVYLDYLNDISYESGLMLGAMVIDTTKEVFSVGLQKNAAKAIIDEAHRVIDGLRTEKNLNTQSNVHITQEVSAADEILKFKQLLDAGILTQEEFDAKKKQLLGL